MDCIDIFKRAAMALQTDSRYLAMDQARKMNDKDEELQNLIGEFNLARMDLNNEIGKNERDDARIAFQPFGTSVGESLFKMEHSQIVDIVVEIHIDAYHLVVEQEPSGFGKAVTVFVLQYGTDG